MTAESYKPEERIHPLPVRIVGSLEKSVDDEAGKSFDKDQGVPYSTHKKNAIDEVGIDAYETEITESKIDQALAYIGMSRDQVEATGHDLGAILPFVAMDKSPDWIREWLSRKT